MTQTLIAIDAARLDRLERRIEELSASLRGATVTPRPEWMSVRAAAEHLSVSPDTIRRRIVSGELEAKGNGKMRRVRIV